MRRYDESLAAYTSYPNVDPNELNTRLLLEKELSSNDEATNSCNMVFDESGNFLLYGSPLGIKVVNIVSNSLSRIIGGSEKDERFTALALYQGVPKVDNQFLLSRAGTTAKSSEEMALAAECPDPTVYTGRYSSKYERLFDNASSFKRRRFYCFSSRPPDETSEGRDVFNELPTEEDRVQDESIESQQRLGSAAVLRTNHGDITIKLFAIECPKTVENFCTHARNGYFNGTVFHRVIKGFMIQGGDPLGDGTGGESIWGGEFEDEFHRSLRHDRAFTVSMANAGPNTYDFSVQVQGNFF